MGLQGKKVAILLEQLYEDPEFWYPYYRLMEAGAQVLVIAPEAREYKSKYGYPAVADLAAKDVKAELYDAIVIPGGYSPDYMRRSPDLIGFVKSAFEKGKLIAAICHGPWILASVGAVKGRKVTAFYSIRDDLINAGADFIDREVVRDGNVITSRKPRDLPAFCREIIAALSE
ncbi:MAG: type 1 glutamine amidotransferase domain-containing protein [Bacillota bacterium]|nr:type 1 glutamine amidotransferase domain-containing protein [Bacillota bacterium]